MKSMFVRIDIPKLFPDITERLAAEQHAIWAHWMKYQFSCCVINEDGSVTIPADKVERWKRQMETPYSDLTDREKLSDIDMATRVINCAFDSEMIDDATVD
jgi:hypothetical protein